MAIVNITIAERISSAPAGVVLVCNNPTDTIEFVFDDEWSAYELKTARFSWANNFIDVPFSGWTVKVPEITNTQYVFVGVYADDIASTPVKLECKRSILCLGGNEYVPPKHTYWDEFVGKLDSKAPNIVADAVGDVIAVHDALDAPLKGLKLLGKTTQDGTPSPEAPIPLVNAGEAGSIAVNAGGKNLVPNSFIADMTLGNDGGTLKMYSSPGTYTVRDILLFPGTYTISGVEKAYVYVYDENMAVDRSITKQNGVTAPYTFTISEKIYVGLVGGVASIGAYQLELGSVATEYEPYKPAQTLTAQTPNGLAGIEDARDEWDAGRGVHIQRIKEVDMGNLAWEYNSALVFQTKTLGKIGLGLMSTNYPFMGVATNGNNDAYRMGDKTLSIYPTDCRIYVRDDDYTDVATFKAAVSGVKLLYIPNTPTETPLTAEEIAAFRALHTNYPNTTIYNDGGAGMGVSYVADTKLYIDGKFAELQNALISMGGNV